MTVNRKLSKVLDLCQDYLCDFHLWGGKGMESMPIKIGQLTVLRSKHFHVQGDRHRVIKNLGANLTFSGIKMFKFWCVQVEWQKDQVTLDTSNPNYYASSQGPAFTLTILKYDITLVYIQREFNPHFQDLEAKAKASCQRKNSKLSLSDSVSV
jgi:hypothetical protein